MDWAPTDWGVNNGSDLGNSSYVDGTDGEGEEREKKKRKKRKDWSLKKGTDHGQWRWAS